MLWSLFWDNNSLQGSRLQDMDSMLSCGSSKNDKNSLEKTLVHLIDHEVNLVDYVPSSWPVPVRENARRKLFYSP